MKYTLTLALIFATKIAICQAPPYIHYQQLQSMNVKATGNNSKVYSWVDTNNIKHSKLFYVGQKFTIQGESKRAVWTIYEIDDLGASYSCDYNNGDGYMAYEALVYMNFIKPKKHLKKKSRIGVSSINTEY